MRLRTERRSTAGEPWASSALVALAAVAACVPSSVPADVGSSETSPASGPPAGRVAPSNALPPSLTHRGEAMVAENAACEACHPDVAEEWRASLHRDSWTEPSFQRAFGREPLPFCQGCHAPEASPVAAPSVALGELGTGCVTCHLVSEGVLAASDVGGSAARAAPHEVIRDGRLDGDAACARCHEFGFPHGGRPLGPEVPMQGTVSEHRASPASGESCASCHMPSEGERHRSHRFASSRDEARLRAAIRVDASRSSASAATITLTSNVRGHAFPTGDLFRRVEVLVEAVAPGEVLVASEARYLTRHFPSVAIRPGGPRHRSIGVDDRLGSEPRTLVLDLGAAAAGRPLRYRVSYQRVAHPRSEDATASELDGEVELASGWLKP